MHDHHMQSPLEHYALIETKPAKTVINKRENNRGSNSRLSPNGGDILLTMERSLSGRNLNKTNSMGSNSEMGDDKTPLERQQTVELKKQPSFSGIKTVWVKINFEQIGEVDTMNEKYQAHVRIKSKWYHVDDGEELIDDEYDPKRHWYPKLYIENALHDVKEELSYKVTRLEDGKILITETRSSRGSFWERIELQNFPIDVQELSITVASRFKSANVKLVADTNKISNLHSEALHTFRDQQKFVLYKMVKTSETASYESDTNSAVSVRSVSSVSDVNDDFHKIHLDQSRRSKFVATVYCSRRPGYYLMNCYAFNFLITVLSLTIFSIETKLAPNRISGTFTLILTSVSFKWVTNRSIPTISYMTSLDRYQIIQIIFLAMCCVWHSTISSITSIEYSKKVFIDRIALFSFAFIFFSIQVVFVIMIWFSYRKIKKLQRMEKKFIQTLSSEDQEADDSDDE